MNKPSSGGITQLKILPALHAELVVRFGGLRRGIVTWSEDLNGLFCRLSGSASFTAVTMHAASRAGRTRSLVDPATGSSIVFGLVVALVGSVETNDASHGLHAVRRNTLDRVLQGMASCRATEYSEVRS